MRLRVASFNIRTSRGRDGRNRWQRRRETCIETIRAFSADIVGLQEVRPDQLDDLRKAFLHATILGAGRDVDGGGEHASVLVAPGEWTVESSETRWLSETPTRPGSRGWDAGLPRVATLAWLRCGATRVGVANTHFDHQGPAARERSGELIATWLDENRDRPWIVLGDLNDVPGSPPLRLLAAAGYTDALPAQAGGTEHSFSGATDRSRIDYILIGPGVRVAAAWIGHERLRGRLPSDHWPVLADLVLD
ncbi:MAG: endonuclease/exonuclease/phosphatase [Pseudonocardiales bacterium]|nr:MAG: endonuclease/exonuclease/phosphatase [Pseudonocardiales bacterium]